MSGKEPKKRFTGEVPQGDERFQESTTSPTIGDSFLDNRFEGYVPQGDERFQGSTTSPTIGDGFLDNRFEGYVPYGDERFQTDTAIVEISISIESGGIIKSYNKRPQIIPL